MKILLINENPVVGKLVTLSAQKTGDELIPVSSVEEVEEGSYDLVLVDDGSYTPELMETLASTCSIVHSCFIGSRTSEKPSIFTRELKKPFLPTDLVDAFMEISSKTESMDQAASDDFIPDEDAEIDTLSTMDEVSDLDGTDSLDELSEIKDLDTLDEELGIDEDNLELIDDTLEDLDDSNEILADDEEELSLELEETVPDEVLENIEDLTDELTEDATESVLDEEDVNEVKNLLEETEEELDD